MKHVLIGLLLIFLLLGISAYADEPADFWLDFGVGSHLPTPVLESGVLDYDASATNTEQHLKCRLLNVTNDDFQKYIEKLKTYGFTEIREAGFNSYYAYHVNKEYSVNVEFYKNSNVMKIDAWSHHETTAYDVLKYLFNTYKPELLCEVCPKLESELIRFGYTIPKQ